MPDALQLMAIAAITGGGLVTGLLYAFSLMVMRALLELPPAQGMATMQRINVLIIRPLFILPFMGTALLCAALLVLLWWRGDGSMGGLAMSAGAMAYLLGPLGVTLAFNVPLNNRLALAQPSEASTQWPRYARAWLRWNHVRSALGALSLALLALGLVGAR